jgi:large subunit ribosomal protein L29
MKAERISGLDAAEIQRRQQDAQEQLFRLRFQMGMGQSEGLKKYRALRKERARLLTVLREKEISGETIPAPLSAPKSKYASAKKSSAAPQAKRSLANLFKRKKK